MQLDDLQTIWARHGARLEQALRVDERLLRELLVGKSKSALMRSAAYGLVEAALGLGAIVLAVRALIHGAEDARTLALAPLVLVYLVGAVAAALAFVALARALDHGEPVAVLQRRLERLRLVEYAGLQWALLGGVVLWLPLPLVLIEGWTGASLLARIDGAWLGANLVFGLTVAVAARAWARRHVEGARPSAFGRRLRDGLSGRGVRQATAHLAELREFGSAP